MMHAALDGLNGHSKTGLCIVLFTAEMLVTIIIRPVSTWCRPTYGSILVVQQAYTISRFLKVVTDYTPILNNYTVRHKKESP